MERKIYENEFYKCWIDKGILYSEYKSKILDLQAAKECVKLRLEAAQGKDYPTLIDGRGVSDITKEARDYFGSTEGSAYITASALIISSVVGKFIGSFFLQINRPKIPVRIFNDVDEAIAWLNQYLK